jgi:arylsulfatase A-like enzyme
MKLLTPRISSRITRLMFVLALGWGWAPVDSVFGGSPADPRLNFIVILADDMGWMDLGCQGSDLHETPHLDQLAREGLRFTDACSAAPVCSPTRAALLTGSHPARLHMTIWREAAVAPPPRNRPLIPPRVVADLPHAATTLAEALQSAGYLTAHVGKWHLGELSHAPETHGFDVSLGGTHWGAPATYFFPYRGVFGQEQEFRFIPHLEFGTQGEYLTDRLTDEAIGVINQAKDRPFFLYLAHHAPHTPTEAKPDLVRHFEQKITATHRHRNPAYAAMIASIDDSVGKIRACLRQRGIADRTVIVFTSDNGGHIGEYRKQRVNDNSPLRSGKGSLYEGGIRVPQIVYWPGVTPAGALCREPVITTDLYWTIRELAGVADDTAPGAARDGVSLAGLLKSPRSGLGRETLYFHYPHYYATTSPVSAVRNGDWKLLEYHETGSRELYNLKDDPGETRNLAAESADRVETLARQLDKWRTSVGAQMPVKNADYRE